MTEHEHRMEMWAPLCQQGGPEGVAPSLLRELGIYGGAQGGWVDSTRTSELTTDGHGVTVGVLHTGEKYADDLSEDGIIYHYPKTNRPPGRDQAEISATKAAREIELPIFVITRPTPSSSKRDVHLGWVEDWDDASEVFLISFGEAKPATPVREISDEAPFKLTEQRPRRKGYVDLRPGQQRFHFQVLKRYGPRCCICSIDAPEVLDAVHLCPKDKGGSDDPRNGLVLCALHHRALDAGVIGIHPDSLQVCFNGDNDERERLVVRFGSIEHLTNRPHRQALQWLWENAFKA